MLLQEKYLFTLHLVTNVLFLAKKGGGGTREVTFNKINMVNVLVEYMYLFDFPGIMPCINIIIILVIFESVWYLNFNLYVYISLINI